MGKTALNRVCENKQPIRPLFYAEYVACLATGIMLALAALGLLILDYFNADKRAIEWLMTLSFAFIFSSIFFLLRYMHLKKKVMS